MNERLDIIQSVCASIVLIVFLATARGCHKETERVKCFRETQQEACLGGR